MIDCAVVGGGIAGLTAAVELASQGARVALYEARPHPGGRAWSFTDAGGDDLDNGQHLLMGCYTATGRLLRTIGSDGLLQHIERLAIPFRRAGGREAVLRAGVLPHPLGIAQAFLGYRFLTLRERMRILHAALPLRVLKEKERAALDELSAGQWLRRCKQSANAIEALWQPIVLATMNTDVEQASAKLLAVVLGEVFLGGAAASALWLPDAGLSALFADPARAFLERHGAEVHLHTPVKRIDPSDSGATVTLADGTAHDSRSVITALPPWDLAGVFDERTFPSDLTFKAAHFIPSPIVSIHLWSRAEFTRQPITGLLGTTLQWVFAKGRSADGMFRYSLTVSAASALLDLGEGAIARLVEEELRVLYPSLRDGDITRVKIIRERSATFAPLPGMERHRPGPESGMPGVFLAGDWTNTGLPATIEGAVRSGETAAARALEFLKRN